MTSRTPDPAPLWSYEDVLSYTGYSRRFVQLAVAEGKLAWTGSPKAKRFRKSDVDSWLDSLARVDEERPAERSRRRRRGRPYVPVIIK